MYIFHFDKISGTMTKSVTNRKRTMTNNLISFEVCDTIFLRIKCNNFVHTRSEVKCVLCTYWYRPLTHTHTHDGYDIRTYEHNRFTFCLYMHALHIATKLWCFMRMEWVILYIKYTIHSYTYIDIVGTLFRMKWTTL